MELYFAFGSNLDHDQMATRCRSTQIVAKAWLKDHRLVFRGHSATRGGAVASVDERSGKRVAGIVYAIDHDDLRRLDIFEGAAYRRRQVTVRKRAGDRLYRCWIYAMTEDYPLAPPTVAYLAQIYCAYAELGFSLKALPAARTAVNVPKRRPMSRQLGLLPLSSSYRKWSSEELVEAIRWQID